MTYRSSRGERLREGGGPAGGRAAGALIAGDGAMAGGAIEGAGAMRAAGATDGAGREAGCGLDGRMVGCADGATKRIEGVAGAGWRVAAGAAGR